MGVIPYKVIFFDLGDTLVDSKRPEWTPGAREVLAQLHGVARLGVISNTGDLTRDKLAALLPADFDWGLFDADLVLLSGEVGIEKPDPRLFRLAVEKSGEPGNRCLYCSENLLESLAAEIAGMHAARITAFQIAELAGALERLSGDKG